MAAFTCRYCRKVFDVTEGFHCPICGLSVFTDEGLPDIFPKVNTPEWGVMNQERAALIRKEIDAELTPAESMRLEYLQRKSRAALETAFPRGQ